MENPRPQLFFALETRRNQSIGPLIRCASAFGVQSLIVVGSKHFSAHGSHGSLRRMNVMHFYYWRDCKAYLQSIFPSIVFAVISQNSNPCGGLESVSTDSVVYTSDFLCLIAQPDVRVPLSEEQCEIADFSMHVRVPNIIYESQLHWSTKISLALQSFGLQKHFSTTSHEGFKFYVTASEESRPERLRGYLSSTVESISLLASEVDAEVDENENDDNPIGSLFET